MSGRIREIHRVIHHVAVAVERLRIPRIGHKRIGGDEAPEDGIVEPGVVVVEPGLIQFLAGEFVRDICR